MVDIEYCLKRCFRSRYCYNESIVPEQGTFARAHSALDMKPRLFGCLILCAIKLAPF